jgi:hypothetical protein
MGKLVHDVIGHRPRKVHRFGFEKQRGVFEKWVNNAEHRYTQTAACGQTLYGDIVRGIDDAAFVNLPIKSQCDRCLWIHPFPDLNALDGRSLPPDAVLELEVQWLWLARLGQAMEAVPHAARGCWFGPMPADVSFAPMPLCLWCRAPSWTDPRRWEWEIATALGGVEKYCYRQVCSGCGHSFRTDRPRGPDPRCNMCGWRGIVFDKRLAEYEEPPRTWSNTDPIAQVRDGIESVRRTGSGYPGGGVER